MSKLNVKIFSKNGIENIPVYQTPQAAGVDLKAVVDEPVILKPFNRALIKTGLFIQLPVGYEAQVRPRSGLALKKGITVLNTPGTVDADYRGEIGVILINLGEEDFTINNGDRIAQLVIAKHEIADFQEVSSVDELSETERGAGGYGHTQV